MKTKLLYTDEPTIRSGYDHDAKRHIKALLIFMGACLILTLALVAMGAN